MILAGDIGGTNARLALFDVRNGQFNLVTATIFPSRNYSGLDQIVNEFVQTSGIAPAQACFGVAGPVTNGEVETSNLPWKIQSRRLADELKIKNALLINDLEATGWGVGALSADDLVALNQITGTSGNQALIAAGVVKQIKAVPPRVHKERPLVPIQGKPLPETIIEERR